MPCCLSDFHHIRPRYEVDQDTLLDWIASTHARAEESSEARDYEHCYNQVKEKIHRLWGGAQAIERKGIHIHDVLEADWQEREIYPVISHPRGKGFTERSQFFDVEASSIFQAFYPGDAPLPPHLIHVTCTGYVAPSPAQKLVAGKNAGERTTVTHAYHMGCYGALSAIRIGSGFLHFSGSESSVDVVHTEMCSLHMHPLRHSMAQLLVQTLFADGFIKYTLSPQTERAHLSVIGLREELIPDSSESMTWRCEDHGLSMTLAKEVPVLIARALEGYLSRLAQSAGIEQEELKKRALFAVHPGGPKILDYIEKMFSLEPHQIRHSKEVLRDFGNMSSATLPHIWERIVQDPEVAEQQLIVSLAFGPGLSISGGIFQKHGGNER